MLSQRFRPVFSRMNIEEVVEITGLLERGATWMGLVANWWVMMPMQGGIFFTTVETKDCILIMVIFMFISFRHVITFTPKVLFPRVEYRTKKSTWANIKELRLPFGFISELYYWCKLFSAIICAVLSIVQLVSQDFGPSTEGENMATRNFALNAFHVLALIEALLSLLDLIMRKFIEPCIEPPPLLPPRESLRPRPLPPPPLSPPPSPQSMRLQPEPEPPKVEEKPPPPPPIELDPPKEEEKLPPPPPKDKRKEKFTIPDEMNTDGQQKDQSDNFGVTRRKGPSVDPAGNGKQTEEKKVEVKKSQ